MPNDHDVTPRLGEEYQSGYLCLRILVGLAYLINTAELAFLLYALVRSDESSPFAAVLGIGYCLLVYLVIYVLNVLAKAVLIARDLAIRAIPPRSAAQSAAQA